MAHTAIPDYLHSFPIPTPFPVGPVNVYLAEGDPLTLVDAGPRYEPARQALEEELAGRGHGVSDLGRIILTHAHADHCGLAAELVRASAIWSGRRSRAAWCAMSGVASLAGGA